MVNLPSKLRYELRHFIQFGQREWRYVCEGALGAVEFWVRSSSTIHVDHDAEFYGGIEIHDARQSHHIGEGAPSHGRCRAISDRACWHSGTSSWASDSWIPQWRRDPNDHDAIWHRLACEYAERFEPKEPE